jgi:hypothetical protein
MTNINPRLSQDLITHWNFRSALLPTSLGLNRLVISRNIGIAGLAKGIPIPGPSTVSPLSLAELSVEFKNLNTGQRAFVESIRPKRISRSALLHLEKILVP